jgi:Ca2+/H+ antiporter, TMEM165/GDT1 family
MRQFKLRKIAGFILLAIAGVFIFGNIVMLLWNALLPVLFHFPLISFWQALGLLLLSKILFGGFRGGPRFHAKRDGLGQAWRNMSPEEREKFKHEWNNRCGKGFDRKTPSPEMAEQDR